MSPIHEAPHPQAGQVVQLRGAGSKIRACEEGGLTDFELEDWWDRVYGQSWMFSDNNPAALGYAARSAFAELPLDNEVVYGEILPNGGKHLIHVSEIVTE